MEGFPASSLLEALPLADAIQRFAAGQRVRRLTLFESLNRSPESGPSRQLITNSNQYGLTTGGYSAEYLELTQEGRLATASDASERARLAARLQLAIERVEPFRQLYRAVRRGPVASSDRPSGCRCRVRRLGRHCG
jgi:hypothetical protein